MVFGRPAQTGESGVFIGAMVPDLWVWRTDYSFFYGAGKIFKPFGCLRHVHGVHYGAGIFHRLDA